jgi:signal transduction histidine kinase/ligand-binding sensor domain-containing protein
MYPDLPLEQLNHRAFTSAEGAPSDISALAQTSDGILWIGGGNGLTRFDGARFMSYPGPSEEPLLSTNISSLAATPDGGLWIGYLFGGVSFLKGGHLRSYAAGAGFPEGTVWQFASDRDGSLWAAARGGLGHFDGERWEKISLDNKLCCVGVLIDRRGTLWIATRDALLARVAGETRFHEVERLDLRSTVSTLLAEAPDGKIWVAAAGKLIRIDRPAALQSSVVVSVSGFADQTMESLAFDGEGNLWTSPLNTAEDMLLRVPARELGREGEHLVRVTPEIFSQTDGLSGDVAPILKDREGNVWTGGSNGLDRFSHTNVVRGPGSCSYPALAEGDAGALWLACRNVPMTRELRDGAVVSQQKTPAFGTAYRDPGGEVWFGGVGELGHIENARVVLTPLPPNLSGTVQALARDRSGAMWVSVIGNGVFRYLDGKWSKYADSALPERSPVVEVADDDGALWFGYPDSRIARLKSGLVQLFDKTHGLEVGNVLSILVKSEDVWVGGELGLAHLHHGHFVPIRSASGAEPFRGISGIVQARTGDLWLNGIDGIVHISREEIVHANLDPAYPVRCDILNYLDGVPGSAVQLRPQPSAIETTDGRVWFSTTGGAVSIDVTHLARNTLPPPVTIWSLTAGHRQFADSGRELSLPIHTTNLQIDYSAGSLTVPERVQFRYKLEGSDRDWQDVGTRREALYTNLGPGHYTFRVIASNNDGVWNTKGASVEFTIAPAFYQTRWFYALCALACIALLTGLYRVRMRQVAAQVRGRLEARLAERERIARELHDTLLQGVQGLIWRFQAATNRIPPDQVARQQMDESLDQADKLLEESRNRVKDLRTGAREDAADLTQALAAEGEQLAQQHSVKFQVSVEGAPRDLHPLVREEGFLIAREALGNAFRHSGARGIEAEVTYGAGALRVRVRDDGRGIGASVLEAGGRPGHYGLIGMRERAKKLGGHLEIWSKPEAGTEIDLRVPAHVAYRRSQGRFPRVRSLLDSVRSSAQAH